MPELPEVETIRRQLAPLVEGRRLTKHRDPRPALVASARARRSSPRRCAGRRVERLGRRGKYLRVELRRRRPPRAAPAHDRRGARRPRPRAGAHARAHRARRRAGPSAAARAGDRRPAPLRHRRAAARAQSAGGVLRRAARRRAVRRGASPPSTCARWRGAGRAPIKAFLLDQRRIAGVGNIYADEALFRAGVHPLRARRDGSRASSTRACARA